MSTSAAELSSYRENWQFFNFQCSPRGLDAQEGLLDRPAVRSVFRARQAIGVMLEGTSLTDYNQIVKSAPPRHNASNDMTILLGGMSESTPDSERLVPSYS